MKSKKNVNMIKSEDTRQINYLDIGFLKIGNNGKGS